MTLSRSMKKLISFWVLSLVSVATFAKPALIIDSVSKTLNLAQNSSAAVRFTIRNNSGVAVTISNIRLNNDGDAITRQTITNNQCQTRLARNGQCEVTATIHALAISGQTKIELQACAFNGGLCAGMKRKITVNSGSGSQPSPSPTSQATISLQGSPLILRKGFGQQSLTISNNSNVTANNINANFTGSPLNGNVTVSGNTCASLAPGANCTITFTAGNTNVALSNVSIAGDNTNTLTAAIRIVTLYLYIVDGEAAPNPSGNDGNVYVCEVNQAGDLSACVDTGYDARAPIPPNYVGTYIIAINSDAGYAYVTNLISASINVCRIDPLDGTFSSCVDSGFDFAGAGVAPLGLKLSNNNTRIEIGLSNNNVKSCGISPADGTFIGCADSVVAGVLTFTAFITLNTQGTFLYSMAADNINTLLHKCDRATDGSLTNCGTAFAGGVGVYGTNVGVPIVNQANTVLLALDANANRVMRCNMNPDGTLQPCSYISAAMADLTYMVLTEDEQTLYLIKQTGVRVRRCVVNNDYSLGACTDLTAPGVPLDVPLAGALALIGP